MAALPLVHTAWITALLASLANAWVLRVRIRIEEEALAEIASPSRTEERPRLLPFGR